MPSWVARAVEVRCQQNRISIADNQELADRVAQAGVAAADDIGTRLWDLLKLDIDDQWTNPLAIIRTGTKYPTEILRSLDCPPVERDDYSKRANPDDIYGLTPASFADLGPGLQDLGISWGAAKAHIHLRRRKEAGQ